ncbi:MAG: DMT family transporter [Hyphomicrobiaceae bacterium]
MTAKPITAGGAQSGGAVATAAVRQHGLGGPRADPAADPAAARATRLGILACVAGMVLFAVGDAMTKVMVASYPVSQIMLVRTWAFLAFAILFAASRRRLISAIEPRRPVLQIVRGVLILLDQMIFAISLKYLGLAEVSAIYATAPLMATALAVPILSEKVGWRRWLAVLVGFVGALLIVRPGAGVFQPIALLTVSGAAVWALYGLATRLASARDSFETSIIFVAIVGAAAATPPGLSSWVMPDKQGWLLFAAFIMTSTAAHLLLMKAYQLAAATILQPFNYVLLATATAIGIGVFGETLSLPTALGMAVVVASGLYIAFRERAHGRAPTAVATERPFRRH